MMSWLGKNKEIAFLALILDGFELLTYGAGRGFCSIFLSRPADARSNP